MSILFFNLANFVVTPRTNCGLKMLKLDRIYDYLSMEEEFLVNQKRLKPQEKTNVNIIWVLTCSNHLSVLS